MRAVTVIVFAASAFSLASCADQHLMPWNLTDPSTYKYAFRLASPQTCGSQGKVFQPQTGTCVEPAYSPPPLSPTVPQPQPFGSVSLPSSVQPLGSNRTPIEKDAVLYKDSAEDLDLIDKLAKIVRSNDDRCDSISAARPMLMSVGFVLSCNQFQYTYDIQDKGGHWLVTVE
jgi:hypothetical protein